MDEAQFELNNKMQCIKVKSVIDANFLHNVDYFDFFHIKRDRSKNFTVLNCGINTDINHSFEYFR